MVGDVPARRTIVENRETSETAAIAADVLTRVQAAILSKSPAQADELAVWFATNGTLLSLVARSLAAEPDLQGRSPESVAGDRLRAIERALVERAHRGTARDQAPAVEAWFTSNAKLLALVGGAVVRRVAQAKPLVAAAGPSLPEQLDPDPDFLTPAARTAANLRAIEVLASGRSIGRNELAILRRYSGWGGLSIDAIASRVPPGWLPEISGKETEYYTPRKLCQEVARVLRPMLATTRGPGERGTFRALEPAAGIGRFIEALSGAGFDLVEWTAVEFSKISALLLQSLHPNVQVFHGPFEQWLASSEPEFAGTLHLVVANPPYGKRGGTVRLDPDPSYREEEAQRYFLRRGLDLLRPGGIGVFLVPYGILTSTAPYSRKMREQILRRHHLSVAFRLPSQLFAGGNIVTDLIFFRARGGELPSALPEDAEVIDGGYFRQNPDHILGRVVGSDEDAPGPKGRRGYEIAGEFDRLPDFTERPVCTSCRVEPFRRARAGAAASRREDLPPYLQAAATLGERVGLFLQAFGATDARSAKTAVALFGELREALLAWQAGRDAVQGERVPWKDRDLQQAARQLPELVAFLSAFEEDGSLAKALQTPPVFAPRYAGAIDDVAAQATHIFETQRRVTLEDLRILRQEIGAPLLKPKTIEQRLLLADWAQDGDEYFPAVTYYSGHLWPKYRRAKDRAEAGDEQAQKQVARLYELIAPPPLAEIAAEPRMPWIPLRVMQGWLAKFTEGDVPPLSREGGLLHIAGKPLAELEQLRPWLQIAFGYINHDYGLFQVPYEKQYLEAQGREETSTEALDRARLAYSAKAMADFATFLAANPELASEVEVSYASTFKGYVQPVYEPRDLEIARWRGRFTLRPHQQAGAWRLVQNGGGLLAFDVGVGKTLTGIATMARLRQEGRARRILIIVPNSIVWKWEKDIRRALPDYRVVVIGAERYVGRNGILRSRTDTQQERALKYRQFQAGEFDCALVTYSMFARTGLRKETLGRFVAATAAVQRELGMAARTEQVRAQGVEAREKSGKRKADKIPLASLAAVRRVLGEDATEDVTGDSLTKLRLEVGERLAREREERERRMQDLLQRLKDGSERERVLFSLMVEEWVADRIELPNQDPGIYWEDLQVDLIILDEAQNFKNLWAVQQREGGLPKYLGAIQEGSERAWQFALRSFEVRERTGGAGVVLLSATPAKNSPLEYFTLLGYVDGKAWERLGITDPEVFIDRYLRLELRWTIEPDLSTKLRSVVAGFKNLNELRDVVFRFADFKTAEEVGLQLPKTERENVVLPMSDVQRNRFGSLADQYRKLMERATTDAAARTKALGLLQRMALVSIHPELDGGPGQQIPADADEQPIAVSDPQEAEGLIETALGDALSVAGIDASDGHADAERHESVRRAPKPKRIPWTWRNAHQVQDPRSPKLVDAVRQIMARRDCGHIVFCDNVAVHYWLRMLLEQAGIPRARIGILNAEVAPMPLQRQVISDKFNGIPAVLNDRGEIETEGEPPTIDIVVANATAYEGIDLQVRTCQVSHLDLPWEPATLQQRNGRAVRQGNMQAVIKIAYLLSERSTDSVRFSVISGKLGWMRDMLASADRETNNPAADSEMSPDEMMLYLSSDADAAKAAIEVMKRTNEFQARERTVQSAWGALRTVANRAASLPGMKDPAEQNLAHKQLDQAKRLLAQIPAEIWPWHFLVPVAEQGVALTTHELQPAAVIAQRPANIAPLWEGGHFTRRSADGDDGFEVGTVRTTVVGVRLLGEWNWTTLDLSTIPEQWAERLGRVTPENFQAAPDLWEAAGSIDRSLVRERLDAQIRTRARITIEDLRLPLASESWRVWLWDNYGQALVGLLVEKDRERRDEPVLVPYLDATGLVDLGELGDGATSRRQVFPWTLDGFRQFINAAANRIGKVAASGLKLTWTVLDQAAVAWWGKRLPRGLGDDAARESDARGTK